ncbi:Rz1-like lysis system protein LysC [Vogesella indigofera]|uniref:Rz1-like lysis system protein LysC n=1 Tax=Vogesella indigofera TaxID=45465 RepID=UPI003570B7C6
MRPTCRPPNWKPPSMKPNPQNNGLLLSCLLLLPACSTTPPAPALQPAPVQIVQPCPPVTACLLPRSAPQRNGQLAAALQQTRAALDACAAKIDAITTCQQRQAKPADD